MVELFHETAESRLDNYIKTNSKVDAIITDIPYAKTSLKWDKFNIDIIKKMFLITDTIITTCQDPLSYKLKAAFAKEFKYSLIWVKSYASANQAKHRPMNNYEEVLVFSKKPFGKMTYNPQMVEGKPYKWNAKRSGGSASGMSYKEDKPINNKGTRYPKSILNFKSQRGLHPTQKPEDLYEWLILTYTNKYDMIWEPYAGSGTTAVVCDKTDRYCVASESNEEYYNIAKERLEKLHG